MYSDWLNIYFSSTNKIKVKGEKKTQPITKEIIKNKIHISGNIPSKWEIILHSAFHMTFIEYENKLKNDIIYSKNILYKSFINDDKKMFEKGKQLYDSSVKNIKKLNNLKEENKNKIAEFDQKIYDEQKNIYLAENMKLVKNIVKHDKLLKDIYSDKKKEIIKINNIENYYLIEKENIIKKGPVPDI